MIKVIVLALLLAGCASPPTVNIPIPIPPPKAPMVEMPHIPLLDVAPEDLDACETASERCGAILNAWEATVESLWGWGGEMQEILRAYQ